MDCSKDFDMVDWVKLFQELMKKGVSAIYLRLLLFLYENQQCDVQWNGKHSKTFLVTNGVRQGAITSPILFGIYMDRLIKELRKSKLGCSIGNFYYGILI